MAAFINFIRKIKKFQEQKSLYITFVCCIFKEHHITRLDFTNMKC